MKLAALLKLPEGKTLEFKRDLSSPEGVLKCVVAMANTSGGALIIGVEDRTKQIRGVADVLDAEERLTSLISDSIRPRLTPDIEIVPWRKLSLLMVRVYPGSKPYHLARLGPVNGVFVRVGSLFSSKRNRKAEPSQIEELKGWGGANSFDEQLIPALYSEAIDFRVASELLTPYRKVSQSTWTTLRIMVPHRGREVPTIGGLLLFGKDRFAQFPDSWIQAGRFAGTNRARMLDSMAIRSYLPRAAEEAVAFVQKHLTNESIITGVRRVDHWSIPLVAVREALMNAVVHADYAQQGAPIRIAIFDDRIEIENPGILPFGLTIPDIMQGVSRLRNRVIGRVFHELRLIEQWGSGIQRMTSACQDAGLAAPKLEEIGMRFRVTIYSTRETKPRTDDTDQRILTLAGRGEPLSTSEVAKEIGLSQRATLTRLKALVTKGLMVELGSGPHDPKRRYLLT